jgi:hypothetical protein
VIARATLAIVLLAEAIAMVCFGIAMSRYPGGTEFDLHAPGHDFWMNFLCDITSDAARNGEPNGGADWARAGMLAMLIAIGSCFMVAPRVFERSPRVGWLVRGFGVACVLASISVPLSAAVHLHALHDFGIMISGPLGFVAALGTAWGLMRSSRTPRLIVVLTAIAITACVVTFTIWIYGLIAGTCSIALPPAQRISVLLTMVWVPTVTGYVSFTSRGAAPP